MPKVIATDLDGTLFFPKRTITLINNKSVKFLRRFIDEGNKVVAISGRNTSGGNLVLKRLKRKVDYIGCNGSFIISDSIKIKDTTFDPSIKDVIEFMENNYHLRAVWLMSENCQFLSKNNFDSIWYFIGYHLYNLAQGVYKNKFVIDRKKFDDEIEHGKVYKIMVMFGTGKKAIERARIANKELREKFPNTAEFSWSKEMIEVTPFGCSKANGLKFYEEYYNIKHDDIFVVGDSGNDISMFNEYKDHSFCMSHAPLSVSKYAKHTLKKFNDLEKYVTKEEGEINE